MLLGYRHYRHHLTAPPLITVHLPRAGLAFYGQGTRVLVGDIVYAWQLIARAVQGYTLKPRYLFIHLSSSVLWVVVLRLTQ